MELLPRKLIVSASRRQDLPGCAPERLLGQILEREFVWRQPYSGRQERLSFEVEEIFCLALWSKDFGSLLQEEARGIVEPLRPYFIFTVNHCPELERGLTPTLEERLAQADEIVQRYGAGRLLWRFDPIVHWETGGGEHRNNLATFEIICQHMAGLGVQRCVFSFAQLYGKVLRRQERLGITFRDPPREEKLQILDGLAHVAGELGVQLQCCCDPEMAEAHPAVIPASCIDAPYLTTVIEADPVGLDLKAHPSREGCGCTRSVDVGQYDGCRHRCAYCYANPRLD